jgi:hypothetical protein
MSTTKKWWLELQAGDSDGNKARIRIDFVVP